jgi:hypothetical protein
LQEPKRFDASLSAFGAFSPEWFEMSGKKKPGTVARPFSPEALLKRRIRAHFKKLGFARANDGTLELPGVEKDDVRKLHSGQRAERLNAGSRFITRALPKILPHFADGAEIDPSKIQLCLIRVHSDTPEADLFRLATLTWSVPVSPGFGRRLRYIVWDAYHERIAGIIALGDPVFNLTVRDKIIGWDSHDRSDRLVNLLDAYVLGAVPPYNMLLGGKAVACLVRSREIYDDFKKTYGKTVGVISGQAKKAALLVVTTTSSMGRSSVYNRLRLADQTYFSPIGYTVGWGHFHITDQLFTEIREYLRLIGHRYADQHKFGEGPNWRLRTIRAALGEIGVNESVLRHGVKRQVFMCPFAGNAIDILKSGKGRPDLTGLLTTSEISDLARERWMVPRAQRQDDYRSWRRSDLAEIIYKPSSYAIQNAAVSTTDIRDGRDAG